MGTGQAALQRLQNLETAALEQMDRALLEVENGFVLCWTKWTTSIGQVVDTRVLGKLDKWYGSRRAWPNWSFVMKAYYRAVNQQLSRDVTSAEISTNVVSNVQLRGVQLYFVLVMVCTRRDLDRIVNSSRGCRTKAWRLLFQAYSPKNDARMVVLMMVVLAVSLDTDDVVTEVGDAMDVSAIVKRSPKGASKSAGRRVRVLVLRERMIADIRTPQDAEEPRNGTVEGFEDRRQQRKEQERFQVQMPQVQ